MADPLLRLDNTRPSAQPGGQARVTVTITNPGTVVEGYQLQVLGVAAQWAEVVPPEVSIYPQQEVTATVVFSPPSGASAPGGLQPFGVMARSTVNVGVSAVCEGDLEIGQVFGLQAKIIPVTSAGRWRGRHVLQVSNWGNTPAQLRLVAWDQDAALGFLVHPEIVDLPIGGKATVRMTVRGKHPFLRGTPVRMPFQVVGERLDALGGPPPAAGAGYGDPSRPVVDGAFTQKPILSKGFVTFVTMVLVGVVGLAAYLLLRPPTPEEALASRGSPPKPEVEVAASTPDSVSLRWKEVDLAEKYTLSRSEGGEGNVTKQEQLDGGLTAYTDTGLKPDTDYCYQLKVTRGGLTGPASGSVCTRTQSPPTPSPTPTPTPSETPTPTVTPSPSPTPTSTITPGDPGSDPIMNQKFVNVVEIFPKTAPDAEANARLAVDTTFAPASITAEVLDTEIYPALLLSLTSTPPVQPAYMVYTGPFDTQEDAEADCQSLVDRGIIDDCQPAQPDP